MLELADRLLPFVVAGERVAVATSIDVVGSAPHLAGTSMALTTSGSVIGSVSGGCVEAAALEGCRSVLAGSAPAVARFGFGDGAAARAGLACGGEIDVLLHPVDGEDAALEAQLRAAAAGEAAAVGIVVTGPAALLGHLLPAGRSDRADFAALGVDEQVRAAVESRLATGRSGPVSIDCGTAVVRLFVDVVAPAARLVIVGATETAAALAAAARAVGYAVTVCDPRPALTTPDRFPAASAVVVARPHEYLTTAPLTRRDAVCLLSHDEDLDPLALAAALERDVFYVGALGSRSTAARRVERMRALGVPESALARLHAPIGLDLGASTPAETAVAIIAELLAARTRSSAGSLTALEGPIHRSPHGYDGSPVDVG